MKNNIHNQSTAYNVGTLMTSYGIRADSVGHLIQFIGDMESLVKEMEKQAFERGYQEGLEQQLNIDQNEKN